MSHRHDDPASGGEPWRDRVDARDALEHAIAAKTLAKAVDSKLDRLGKKIDALAEAIADLAKTHAVYSAAIDAAETGELETKAIRDSVINRQLSDHEDRIRGNERFRYSAPVSAAAAILSALAAILAAAN